MKHTIRFNGIRLLLLAASVLCVSAVAALPQSGGSYDLARNTVDGGGVVQSTGGGFVLSATIGQTDAGVMTGGEFQLSGGFWFGLPPTDCNDDGLVGLLDHETITSCLLGPDGGIGADPCPCFDVDHDGDITLSDYAQLQAGFTGE